MSTKNVLAATLGENKIEILCCAAILGRFCRPMSHCDGTSDCSYIRLGLPPLLFFSLEQRFHRYPQSLYLKRSEGLREIANTRDLGSTLKSERENNR